MKDRLMFTPFFLGVIFNFCASSIMHTFECVSEKVLEMTSRIDYIGITLNIIGSIVSFSYFAFYGQSVLQITYFALTCLLGIPCIILQTRKALTPKGIRVATFVSFGLFSSLPFTHMLVQNGPGLFGAESVKSFLKMGTLYLSGAFVYARHLPEKWYPGRFDYFLHSHQIMHVMAVCAAAYHYKGLCELAQHHLDHC